ncbi:MAG: ABC transporter permease [Deltaproteobacteria bacterium]|nr:ABC transporter permease [Deltaproteobacteria bacterium]
MRLFPKKFSVRDLAVPLLFVLLCLVGVVYSGQPASFLINAIVERLGRNSFLVISLIIPIIAGIGLNFSIVLGAMAAQIALIFTIDWGFSGIGGLGFAFLLSVLPATVFGFLIGKLFNRAKGREMVTGLITGFFSNGIYQLIFLFGAGAVFPILNADSLLPRGVDENGVARFFGLRNTIDLSAVQYALDDLIALPRPQGIVIPYGTFLVIALACLFVWYFRKTKLGQEMKAMGHDQHVAEVAGINVNRNRIVATIISTVMAAWGQIIFLQNIGTINTYNSHEQVGMFAIAALLVSGASVSKASVWNALFGTFLFHTLFITSPLAGNQLFGEAQLGEYFRVFVAYGVIAVALALHAWKGKKN